MTVKNNGVVETKAKKENGMNKEEIIRMAREAGGDDWGIFKDFMPEIERFAALVAAAEREACIDIAEQHATIEGIAQKIIADIRAREQK